MLSCGVACASWRHAVADEGSAAGRGMHQRLPNPTWGFCVAGSIKTGSPGGAFFQQTATSGHCTERCKRARVKWQQGSSSSCPAHTASSHQGPGCVSPFCSLLPQEASEDGYARGGNRDRSAFLPQVRLQKGISRSCAAGIARRGHGGSGSRTPTSCGATSCVRCGIVCVCGMSTEMQVHRVSGNLCHACCGLP